MEKISEIPSRNFESQEPHVAGRLRNAGIIICSRTKDRKLAINKINVIIFLDEGQHTRIE